MEKIGAFLILAALVAVIMFFKYLLRRGVDKIDDSIRHAIDRKTGKMNESESSNLSDRFN
ncbi:MAG: hypothetical protein ILP17_12470 [Lachnospiraceae bacterium]|nr:hypothetical protein [Lachnospiraceae bacterium]